MNYVKHFSVLGVDTRQVACIELRGAPTAATEGAVGVLGIDVTSPTKDLYKCVAVNGGIYTWELLEKTPDAKDGTDGFSLLVAVESRLGLSVATFPFYQLNIPNGYTPKVGDLIIDPDTYLYQVTVVETDSCTAAYLNVRLAYSPVRGKDYWTDEDKEEIISECSPVRGEDYWTDEDKKEIVDTTVEQFTTEKSGIIEFVNNIFQTLGGTSLSIAQIAVGSYRATSSRAQTINLDFSPKFVLCASQDIRNAYAFVIFSDGDEAVFTTPLTGYAITTVTRFDKGIYWNTDLVNYGIQTYSYVAIG